MRTGFLGLAFRLLYNQLAFTYDLVSWTVSMGQWRSWQRCALPFLRGPRVLEVAHGTGDMLLDASAAGFAVTGLDLSPSMSRLARRKLARRPPGPARPVPLLRGRVQALPFAGAAFDSLLSTFPTEFIAQPDAIAEFYRVLAPGGVLVSVPAAQITGPALPDRAAAWLFRVTGQSAPGWTDPLIARYQAAGFSARLVWVRLPRSRVAVVVAVKEAGH